METAVITPQVTNINASEASIGMDSAGGFKEAQEVKVSTLEDLKKNYPELYKAMVESIAGQITRQSQRMNDRLISKQREQRRNDG